jgi:hypothetical protein
MKLSFKSFNIALILLILFISLGMVSAQDNTTQTTPDEIILSDNVADDTVNIEDDLSAADENVSAADTQIITNNVDSYYKEKTNLVSYLKDANGAPINNKQVSVSLNGKIYNKITDGSGKITLALNLKPSTYNVLVKFEGDENFTASESSSVVKIKKAPLAIKMNNFNTYSNSNSFFKVKVYNKVTGKVVSGIRIAFKVYSLKTKKYSYYYATTDSKGIATLNKNLKVGTYKISTQIKDSKNKKYISYKDSKNKVTMKVKSCVGEDCCSFFLQVSGTEAVAGFRRDNTAMTTITVKEDKLGGIPVIKHTNANGFVHLIVFANGWIVGNGGLDSHDFINSMEKLAVDMVKSNKIKMSSLKKIYRYKRSINFGHFSIKAPNGQYAVVWKNKIITGKLKPGEFSCSPNFKEYYRHSTYKKYSTNPAKAAIKVGATDKYGVNRRQIVALHWKTTTDKNFKTTSSIKAYVANDNGRYVGVSSGWRVDNVRFKDKFFSSSKIPKVPSMKYMGSHSFGNIDSLVKIPTTVKAPSVTNPFNETKYFKVTVKNKNTNKVISYSKIKIKVSNKNLTKWYTVKTNKNGVASLNTKQLMVGNYDVVISQANSKYYITAKSKIVVR